MPACFSLCTRDSEEPKSKTGRCILCGEINCSGCKALLHKEYLHGRSERRARNKLDQGGESQSSHAHKDDELPNLSVIRDNCSHRSRGSVYASAKKDACFYSQSSVSSGGGQSGEDAEGKDRGNAAGRPGGVQVWFREPQICRQKDRGVMFVPHEFTEYEFVMQWSPPAGGDRRWVVRRRFREFSALDKSLDETLPESVQLPQFPQKAAFGRMSPSLVRTRRMALEQYLRAILRDIDMRVLKQVRLFCKMPEGCNEEVAEVPWQEWKHERDAKSRSQQG